MKNSKILLLLLLLVFGSACRTQKISPEEKQIIKEAKAEQQELDKLLKEAKKQHLSNQNKETLKMMRKSEKYNRKLNKRKRK